MKKFRIPVLILAFAVAGVAAAQQGRTSRATGLPPIHSYPWIKYKGCFDYNKIHSKEEFYRCEDAYIDSLIANWGKQVKPGQKLIFMGQAIPFLHGAVIGRFPVETLIKYLDAMQEAGSTVVDINPSPQVWLKPIPESIAKYDAALARARKLGMQISFNPTTFPGWDPLVDYNGYFKEAMIFYAELARRYKPDIFSVMHEPISMDHRLGGHVTPKQWAEFTAATCSLVKRESPDTKCVTSYLPCDIEVLEEVVKVPVLDGIGLDIYQEFDDFQTFDKMIAMAKANGKFAYIAETWRPMIIFRDGVLDNDPAASVPDLLLSKLDGKWFKAMTYYALTRGLEAMNVWWTSGFFAYDGSPSGTSPEFGAAGEKALLRGERTATFSAFKALAAQFGKRGICAECAK
jgi:hypothetical protein